MDNQELDSFLSDLRSHKIDRDQAAFEKLIRQLQNVEWNARWSYFRVLEELANERALAPLIALIQKGGAMWITSDAIAALGKIGGPEAINVLVAATVDRWNRTEALWALAEIGGPEAVNTHIEALRFLDDESEPDSDRDSRNAAQSGLESMGNTILEPLIAALNHKDDRVRYSIAEILGVIGDPSAIQPLKVALDREKDEVNQDSIRRALDKLENN